MLDLRSLPLPHAQSYAWSTYNTASKQLVCKGANCRAYAVIECVQAGAKPLKPDANGNVGCGNTGKNSIGSWNTGDGNWGSCNAGGYRWRGCGTVAEGDRAVCCTVS